MTNNEDADQDPNVDPEDLPDDGGVEVEKGYGTNDGEKEPDSDN
jgi:hypothetical protein